MLDWDRFIAGFVSGFSFQLLHPLDLMRIRFQAGSRSQFTNLPRYNSYNELFQKMRQQEGLRSFYKGVLFSIIPNASFGFFMMFNHFFKQKLQTIQFFRQQQGILQFAAAAGSSFLISAFFNPLYVVKTWKVIDQNSFQQRLSMWQICSEIKCKNGLMGFMRGYTLMVVTAVNGSLTLGIIDWFKYKYPDAYATSYGTFLVSGLARALSSALLYPLSTIRTRITQNQSFQGLEGLKYSGIRDCFYKIKKEEGLGAFYRGIGANTIKAFMSSGVLFFVYEGTFKFLKNRSK